VDGTKVHVCGVRSSFADLEVYFRRFAQLRPNSGLFSEELTHASLLMRQLPSAYYVYFYSDRWRTIIRRGYICRRLRASKTVPRVRHSNEWSLTSDHAKVSPPLCAWRIPRYLPDSQELYPGGTIVTGSPIPWKPLERPKARSKFS
jgi:hypothetical protein